ncbi:cell adhesion molecule 2-like isoform X1 [Gigantopelta aegis]|uniref:cell adhesion molecule 2-like isoform X1 n=1 Tax=Gigantopelta aegis TaxID=1735272 RepID=UPI001B887F3F|nr:cell adhesion molecule 2-like isoform X1 [Gigantopelta aegis]
MTTNVGSIETVDVDQGFAFSQSLQITPAWYQDGDVIKCEVTNTEIPNSNPVITSINLDLLFAPISVPEINGYTSGTPVREGDFLNISCQVTGGKPLVSNIKLVCDGADSTSIQIKEQDTVISYTWFRVLRILHDKVCGCSAVHVTNKYKLASVVTLFVNYAPSVTLRTEFRRQTRSVRLICEARGRPAVFHFSRFTHSWRGRRIRELTGELEPPHKYVLTIQPYRYSDSGSYQCAVSNDIIGLNTVTQQLGSISVNMEVQPALVDATKQNEMIQANIGDRVILNKTIFSWADITYYRWINQGRKIMKSRISTTDVILNIYTTKVMDVAYIVSLVIERIGEIHTGLYVLRVCNKFGCAQFYTHLEAAGDLLPAVNEHLIPIVAGVAGALILLMVVVVAFVVYNLRKTRIAKEEDTYMHLNNTERPANSDGGECEHSYETINNITVQENRGEGDGQAVEDMNSHNQSPNPYQNIQIPVSVLQIRIMTANLATFINRCRQHVKYIH